MESIKIFREETSIEDFKKGIKLLESAGYEVFEQSDDYVKFYQTATVINSDLLNNKKYIQKNKTQ